MSSEFSAWKQMMESMMGKVVKVTISTDPLKQQVGKLVSYSDEGEVELRDKYAVHHYIWPNLDIEEYHAPEYS